MTLPPELVERVMDVLAENVPGIPHCATRTQSEAAITATIEWLKENVSGEMCRAALIEYGENIKTCTPKDTFCAMLDAIGEKKDEN